MKKIIIIGAGGLAEEIRWLIDDINEKNKQYDFIGFIVSDLKKIRENNSKKMILGDYSWFKQNKINNTVFALGIGNPHHRLKVAKELLEISGNILFPNLIHPTAQIQNKSIKLGKGNIICANTVITVNVKIKDYVLVNLCSSIGHDSIIGNGSVINPGVRISGGVELGRGVLVGTNAAILQYLMIGDLSKIGAGAVVTKSIPQRVTAVGIPAKVINE